MFRDLMERETAMPRWRELLGMFRRMEARGTVRGGRFVSGFGGEQFALPEALESLRALREPQALRGRDSVTDVVTYSAADPMNLVGIVIPGEREAAVPGRSVTYPITNAVTEQKIEDAAPVSAGVLPFSAAIQGGALG
jgi:ATP-dependent Lhr-like helicase